MAGRLIIAGLHRQFALSIARLGAITVLLMAVLCVASLPYTLGRPAGAMGIESAGGAWGARRFEATNLDAAMLPPFWAYHAPDELERLRALEQSLGRPVRSWMGTDRLGRSVAVRCLAGGAISLSIGLLAAAISVVIGTLYGTLAGWAGGRIDAALMRIVDVLYGLPYILLVVLLAVAVDGMMENAAEGGAAGGGVNPSTRQAINIITLLAAIGGVSWLTMARVIRGQVLSLKQQPFMEACRAIGVPLRRQFARHLLPNLLGPIIVYATLTVPTAILSESFLSFLGIGVREPTPSWGNLAAAGLSELNTVRARWWLLLWPCLLLAITLLGLNFMGEGLRQRFDPRAANVRG